MKNYGIIKFKMFKHPVLSTFTRKVKSYRSRRLLAILGILERLAQSSKSIRACIRPSGRYPPVVKWLKIELYIK